LKGYMGEGERMRGTRWQRKEAAGKRNLIEWVGEREQRMNERMNERIKGRGSILPQATCEWASEAKVIRMTKQSENVGF